MTVSQRAGLFRSLLRSERARMNAPAVRLAAQRRQMEASNQPSWKKCMRRWKNHLGECKRATQLVLSLSWPDGANVQIPFGGHKGAAAARELFAAGLPKDKVKVVYSSPRIAGMLFPAHAVKILLRAVMIRVGLALRLRQSEKFINVIFLFILIEQAFRKLQRGYWLINGDLSSGLIALAAVARVHSHTVVAWQQDYLDFKPLPVSPDGAAVLNESGRRLATGLRHGPKRPEVFWRAGLTIRPMNLDVEARPVGIMLNSQAAMSELEKIKDIRDRFGSNLVVRFHPSSVLDLALLGPGFEVSTIDESIESFVARTGLIFSSTTTTILKAICLGAPVIQLDCLDRIGFPHLDYVKRGVAIGFKDVSAVDIDAVHEFYRSDTARSALLDLVGSDKTESRQGLVDLVDWLGYRHVD